MMTLENVRLRAEIDAKTHGYHLTPDPAFLNDLLEGLKKNEERYGYPSCPCRAASGQFELDRDIICPCDYRDPDVEEFGACYCALYVSRDVFEGKRTLGQIPERRPAIKQSLALGLEQGIPSEVVSEQVIPVKGAVAAVERKIFYCRQCGYVVFREEPPYVCPICRAKREFFAGIDLKMTSL